MPKEDKEELKKQAEQTFDETKRHQLKEAIKKEELTQQVISEQDEMIKEEQIKQQEQKPAQRSMPNWLTPENRAVLHLVGFDRKNFNEQNFIQHLKKVGIEVKDLQKNVSGYQLKYGNNQYANLDLENATITTNDLSQNGFGQVAKLAAASGANSVNASQFIKEQQKANNTNLDSSLKIAYSAMGNEGLALVGLGEKESSIAKLAEKSPFQIPKLQKE